MGVSYRKFNEPRLIFVLSFIALFFLMGLHKVVLLRPQSIHQWAQCDRASVAWNYYTGDYDFFRPRVNNIANGSGITGLEFPIIQYFVALLYGVLGFHEWIYRSFTLMVSFFGLFSAWRVAQYFTGSRWASSLIVLFLACSPLVAYYSVSFIPDIYSMSLVMIALYMLVKEQSTGSRSYSLLHWFFLSLACLIKPTFLIYLPVMLVMRISNGEPNQWKRSVAHFMKGSAFIVFVTACWYSYAKWLSSTEHSGIFLLQARPLQDWDQWMMVFDSIQTNWLRRVFHPVVWGALFGLFICSLLLNRRKWTMMALMVFSVLPGFAMWVWLMGRQLPDHDYYALLIMPVLFFILVEVAQGLIQIKSRKVGTSIVIGCLSVLAIQFYEAKTHIRTSHKKDNWKYGYPFYDDYFKGMDVLDRAGIPRKEPIFSAFDPTPNVSLYLLGRKGINIPGPDELDWMLKNPEQPMVKYLLLNERSKEGLNAIDTSVYPWREVYHEAPFRLYAFKKQDN